LSIGGYGEGNYSAKVGDKGSSNDSADMARMVLYAGYKFTDRILFNSEMSSSMVLLVKAPRQKAKFLSNSRHWIFFIDQKPMLAAGLVLMPMGLGQPNS